MSTADHNTWTLILAAGDGKRLRALTTTASGTTVPKQFCSLHGGPSLLHDAVRRAQSISPQTRICAVVAEQHRHWWSTALGSLMPANVVVQPQNRGTANGILLPLLHIMERDPDASVVLLPADHHVEDEPVLAAALRHAVTQLATHPRAMMLLGIEPDGPDQELGYIVPKAGDGAGSSKIAHFVEKPNRLRAQQLIDEGGLWNAFIIAARAQSLLSLFTARYPEIVTDMQVMRFQAQRVAGVLENFYRHLPDLDFSRDVLQGQERHLRVVPVPCCGWTDLGTPQRVADVLRGSAHDTYLDPVMDEYLCLAVQHQRLQLSNHFTGKLAGQ